MGGGCHTTITTHVSINNLYPEGNKWEKPDFPITIGVYHPCVLWGRPGFLQATILTIFQVDMKGKEGTFEKVVVNVM